MLNDVVTFVGEDNVVQSVSICLKFVAPLMVVLRLVDCDQQPSMGFIYVEMDRAKERIKNNFNNVKKNYEPVWEIIDRRFIQRGENRLHKKKMNNLVYVMYNLKLKSRQIRKVVALPFENMKSNDEWITKQGDDIFYENNVQVKQEQPLGENDSGNNIDLVGKSLTDPTLDVFDIDNLILNDNVKDHFSTKEELEDDGEEENVGDSDIRDNFIKGLMDI
ncbi:hypothetical protein GmHk_01G002145 [Glycine max]|nr:hypothetical protein GmHk_01G002145 [Glycine max]